MEDMYRCYAQLKIGAIAQDHVKSKHKYIFLNYIILIIITKITKILQSW